MFGRVYTWSVLATIAVSILLVLSFEAVPVATNVIDIIADEPYDRPWLEIGRCFVGSEGWVSIMASYSNFTSPVVLISMPEVGDSTAINGFPVVPRIRNVEVFREDPDTSRVTFEARLFLVNESYCVETLYSPQYLNPLPITWMVAESGAYNVSNHYFIVGSSPIYRIDETFSGYNQIEISYPLGCKNSIINGTCHFPKGLPVQSISVVTQIQTLMYDRYLLVRGISISRDSFTSVLVSHDSFEETYFRLINPNETVGYMAFEANIQLNCAEMITLQTFASIGDVTSVDNSLPFLMDYIRPPGVFGMLTSFIGKDSTALRIFDTSRSSVGIIAQEDQCWDEEVTHSEAESASLLVVGVPTDFIGTDEDVCGVVYNDKTCITYLPGPDTATATRLTIFGYSDITNISFSAIDSVIGRAAVQDAVLLSQSPYIYPGDVIVEGSEPSIYGCSLLNAILSNYSNATLVVSENTTRMFWQVPFIVEEAGYNSTEEALYAFTNILAENVADGDFIAAIRNYEWITAGAVLELIYPVGVYCYYAELLYSPAPTQEPVIRRSSSHNPIDTPYFIPVIVTLGLLILICLICVLFMCCMTNRKERKEEEEKATAVPVAAVSSSSGRVLPEDSILDDSVAARIRRRGLNV